MEEIILAIKKILSVFKHTGKKDLKKIKIAGHGRRPGAAVGPGDGALPLQHCRTQRQRRPPGAARRARSPRVPRALRRERAGAGPGAQGPRQRQEGRQRRPPRSARGTEARPARGAPAAHHSRRRRPAIPAGRARADPGAGEEGGPGAA